LGSGSLARDLLEFVFDSTLPHKLILFFDKYFYGHRANTIIDLLSNTPERLILDSNKGAKHGSDIQRIKVNLEKKVFNNLKLVDHDHYTFQSHSDFQNSIKQYVDQSSKKEHVITRKKEETASLNNWIREYKGDVGKEVQIGDLLQLTNRVLIPEDDDPFAIPKVANNGDIVQVVEIYNRESFESVKYTYSVAINITKCKVVFRDYDTYRDIYLSTYSRSDIKADSGNFDGDQRYRELLKHRQIRLRELVDEYLRANQIELVKILSPEEYSDFKREEERIKAEALFEEEGKEFNKLYQKLKVNQRKEEYARAQLLEDHNSEYFKIKQMAQYNYAWALTLKNIYGYNLDIAHVMKYPQTIQHAERFHKYIYSALSVSSDLEFDGQIVLTPWINLSVNVNLDEIKLVSARPTLKMMSIQNIGEREQHVITKYNFDSTKTELIHLLFLLQSRLSAIDVKIDTIVHHNFQECYHLSKGNESCAIQFFYNGNWEVSRMKPQKPNELASSIIKAIESNVNTEPWQDFNLKEWRHVEYKRLQAKLNSSDAFISHIDEGNWLDKLTVLCENESCLVSLNYNQNGFFSHFRIEHKTGDHPVAAFLEAINRLNHEERNH
jgi:hypothetical protein